MGVRALWIADDDDEASYAAASGVPGLTVEWRRVVPPLDLLAAFDLIVVDPGALPVSPDAFERRVHEELLSLPIVFYSALRPEHHARGGVGLRWAIGELVTWLTHAEAPLAGELPRRLVEIGRAA
ncbi:MAG TPA: hypothetical protein VG370_02695 [Chloroflexota bacterium]|jgi:hypothetical protein|nr:hypothetical protein [Chloroflexota bacterium]